jgi:16S rRNA processing protein RimM
MISLDDCIELGLIAKPHGYKGQLILKLNKLSFDEIEEMEWVYILIDGLPVPFSISEFGERSNDSLFILLNNINSEEKARSICNCKAYIQKDIVNAKNSLSLSLFLVEGYTVIDNTAGKIGVVDSVIENAQNPLLRILDFKKEILLPLQEDLLVRIDKKSKEIFVNCPKGLLEIY